MSQQKSHARLPYVLDSPDKIPPRWDSQNAVPTAAAAQRGVAVYGSAPLVPSAGSVRGAAGSHTSTARSSRRVGTGVQPRTTWSEHATSGVPATPVGVRHTAVGGAGSEIRFPECPP